MAVTNSNTYFLFSNQTTDGNGTPVTVNYPNKVAVVKVWGTFGGASIILQTLAPQTNPAVWINIPDMNGNNLSFTTNAQCTLQYLVQNEQVRAVQSGSTGTTTLNASLEIY
jgi:hypothetical protein